MVRRRSYVLFVRDFESKTTYKSFLVRNNVWSGKAGLGQDSAGFDSRCPPPDDLYRRYNTGTFLNLLRQIPAKYKPHVLFCTQCMFPYLRLQCGRGPADLLTRAPARLEGCQPAALPLTSGEGGGGDTSNPCPSSLMILKEKKAKYRQNGGWKNFRCMCDGFAENVPVIRTRQLLF